MKEVHKKSETFCGRVRNFLENSNAVHDNLRNQLVRGILINQYL
jgi:hypothetical protein